MPDPTRETISATEAAALFGASPYTTRWMLYQRFAKGSDLDTGEDVRMDWGKRMQPLLLAAAAQDLRLEVKPNASDTYIRNARFGCTRDADIICPDRGPGALETKCAFDYGVWMRDWDGGKMPPRHHEIQLQVQMYVGDGEKPFHWGVLAAWVGGEMHYFEREPIPALWDEMNREAVQFFEDVRAGREPNAFGEPVEYPLMKQLFLAESGRIIDMREDQNGSALADDMRAYVSNGEAERFHSKERERLKLKFLALLNGADELLLPDGVKLSLKRSSRAGYTVKPATTLTLKPFVPATGDDLIMAG